MSEAKQEGLVGSGGAGGGKHESSCLSKDQDHEPNAVRVRKRFAEVSASSAGGRCCLSLVGCVRAPAAGSLSQPWVWAASSKGAGENFLQGSQCAACTADLFIRDAFNMINVEGFAN